MENIINKLFGTLFNKPVIVPEKPIKARLKLPSSARAEELERQRVSAATFQTREFKQFGDGVTADSALSSLKPDLSYGLGGLSVQELTWFGKHAFIGYNACALLAQNWLIDKCISIPSPCVTNGILNLTESEILPS